MMTDTETTITNEMIGARRAQSAIIPAVILLRERSARRS